MAADRGSTSRRSLILGGAALLTTGCTARPEPPGTVPPVHPGAEPPGTVPSVHAGGAWASEVRFDLDAPPIPVLAGVRLHEARRPMQGIGYDVANRRLFVSQQRDGRPGADLCVNQLGHDGEVVATMHFDRAGHGQSFGVESVGSDSYLWLECDANENGTDGRGTALARFRFDPERRPRLRKFFEDGVEVGCAIDPVNARLLIRRPEGGRTVFTLFDLADGRPNLASPRARFVEPDLTPEAGRPVVLQAFTVLGRYAYTFVGTRGHDGTSADPFDSYLSAIDMTTGTLVQQVLTTAGGSLPHREPEGLAIDVVDGVPQLCFGLASGPSPNSARRLANVFRIPGR